MRSRRKYLDNMDAAVLPGCQDSAQWFESMRLWYEIANGWKQKQILASMPARVKEECNSSKENPEVPKFTAFLTNGRAMRETSGRAGSMGELSLGGAE